MPTKNAIDGKRQNAFLVDPEDLTIVGLDTEDGPEHPLWDQRIKMSVPEPLVKNIIAEGVHEIVLVRKAEGQVQVVNGRQRVRAAREANKRLRKSGCEPVMVTVATKKGSDAYLAGVMVTTNEQRQDDMPSVKAEKAARLLNLGRTEEEVGVIFGCTAQTIKNYLRFTELSAPVKHAVDKGTVSMTAALKLHGLSREEQQEGIAELKKRNGGVRKSVAPRKPGVRGPSTSLPKATLHALCIEHGQDLPSLFVDGILYALGEGKNTAADKLLKKMGVDEETGRLPKKSRKKRQQEAEA